MKAATEGFRKMEGDEHKSGENGNGDGETQGSWRAREQGITAASQESVKATSTGHSLMKILGKESTEVGPTLTAHEKVKKELDKIEEQKKKPSVAGKVDRALSRACFFTVMDVIEDDCRVRQLNIWAFLLIYVFFVLSLLKLAPKEPINLATVSFDSEPPDSIISGPFSWQSQRTMKATVLNDNGSPRQGVDIKARVVHFNPANPLLPCVYPDMDRYVGTIEHEKWKKICAFTVRGKGTSDDLGLGVIKDFEIEGPAGTYYLSVEAMGGNGSSGLAAEQEFTTMVRTAVARMRVVHPDNPDRQLMAPAEATIGVPLPVQPAVQLLDKDDNPISGLVVMCFANQDPGWPPMTIMGKSPDYNRLGQKFSFLSGDVSEYSDANGVARFTNLTVVSSTSPNVNFVFVVNGILFAPWNDHFFTMDNVYDMEMKGYRRPTMLHTAVDEIQMQSPAAEPVQEGNVILGQDGRPVRLKVTNLQGQPVAGITCFALAYMENRDYNVLLFRRSLKGILNKELLNAISEPSDADGFVEFPDLRWSVFGPTVSVANIGWYNPSNKFQMIFSCDGKFSYPSNEFAVTSRVKEVEIKRFLKTEIFVSKFVDADTAANDGDDIITAVLRVKDRAGPGAAGVAGKSVAVYCDGTNYPLTPAVHVSSLGRQPSSTQGFLVVAIKVSAAAAGQTYEGGSGYIQVRFTVDGVWTDLSPPLKVMLRNPINPNICHFILMSQIAVFDASYNVTAVYDPLSSDERIAIPSGRIFMARINFTGATMGTPVSFANVVNSSDSSRRLSETESFMQMAERVGQQLKERGGIQGLDVSRRLATNDGGQIQMKALDKYSNDGEQVCYGSQCTLLTRYQPTLTLTSFVNQLLQIPIPTLKDLNDNDGSVISVVQIQGPVATHWLSLQASITVDGRPDLTQECASPSLALDVTNNIGAILAFDVNNAHSTIESTVHSYVGGTDTIEFELWFYGSAQSDGVPPSQLYFINELYLDGSIYFRFEQIPLMWQSIFGLINGDMPLSKASTSDPYIWSISQSSVYEVDTIRGEQVGRVRLKMQFAWPGLFGKFAVMFGAQGMFSNVVEFELAEPPNLAIEVLQDPGLGSASSPFYSQTYLPIQPIVRVTSNGQPVKGVMLFVQTVPANEESQSVKLTTYPMYSAINVGYSTPSGFNTTDGSSLRDGAEGVAVFSDAMLMDGSGCFYFEFVASHTIKSQARPSSPICFQSIVSFNIISNPPQTLPLNMPLGEVQGGAGSTSMVVQMTYEGDGGSLYNWHKIAMARIVLAKYLGKNQAQNESALNTRDLLENNNCLWIAGQELMNLCSPLQVIQTSPSIIVQFTVYGLIWKRIKVENTKITLTATDLSMTSLAAPNQIAMPSGFLSYSTLAKTAFCMEALSQGMAAVKETPEISPEKNPSSAVVTLDAPPTVEVGAMFLMRLRVLTQRGGKIGNVLVKVGIVNTRKLDPNIAGGNLLQSFAKIGNNLKAFKSQKAKLHPDGTAQVSDKDGLVSFPISIARAESGTYVLKFQSETPPAKILYTSQAITVINPIVAVREAPNDNWGELEIDNFDKNVSMPRRLKMQVVISGNRSLEQLADNGITLEIHLRLKGVSRKVLAEINKMQNAAVDAASQATEEAIKTASQSTIVADTVKRVSLEVLQKIDQQNPLAAMAPELQDACIKTGLGGFAAMANTTYVREPMMAQAMQNSAESLVPPAEDITQFIRTITGGGAAMAASSSMALQLALDIGYEDVELVPNTATTDENGNFVGVYQVTKDIRFKFKENNQYQWTASINGVVSGKEAFQVFDAVKVKLTDTEVAVNWLITSIAGVLGVVVLVSNTMKHHWIWFALAIPVTIVVICMCPSMKGSKEALDDKWPVVAIINCGIIILCLIWGIVTTVNGQIIPRYKSEMKDKVANYGIPFAQKRRMVFEEYTNRRLRQLIGRRGGEPHVSTLSVSQQCKQIFKPFAAETAFYFPSQVWVGFVLSLFSYGYILIKSIKVMDSIREALYALLDKTINAVITLTVQMENTFKETTGAQLPDAATSFMLDQLRLVRGWFEGLVEALEIGMTIGIVLAGIITFLCLFQTMFCFRKNVLLCRNGQQCFKEGEGSVVYDATFMGQTIATTIVGFICVVFLSVIITLPFAWPLLWNIIWSLKWHILGLFGVTFILEKIGLILAKKIMFTTTYTRHRAAASIFMFWQTWLSILSGVTVAITRFVMALIGIMIGMPGLAFPVTAPFFNHIYLMDSSHKAYLAAVQMFHNHNHPILITAVNCLLEGLRRKQQLIDLGASRTEVEEKARKRNRCWLVLLLIKHPWLAMHRKAAIRTALEQKQLKAMLTTKVVKTGLGKPPKDEVLLKAAILQQKQLQERALFHQQTLERYMDRISGMPAGDARKSLVQKALEEVKYMEELDKVEKPLEQPSSQPFTLNT